MKTEIAISGMTCANCAARIERGLKKIEGIGTVEVNYATENARLSFDPKKVSNKEIAEAIREIGYEPILQEEESEAVRERELRNLKITTLISALLSFPLFWPMFHHFSATSFVPVPDLLKNGYFQLLLATPVQFVIGWRFYKGAWLSLKAGTSNMDVLVALGTSAAWIYSLATLLAGHTDFYFETSAVLITLILLGKVIESSSKKKTGLALSALKKLRPQTARRITEEGAKEVPISEIRVGDLVQIHAGEQIPVDGSIEKGEASIDESMLTGESMPQNKGKGDPVIAATLCLEGSLQIRCEVTGAATTFEKIIKIVQEAAGSRAELQRIADRVSAYFVPFVVLSSIVTFLVWYFGMEAGLALSLKNAIAVMVIACPCALGLATPTSIMVGSGLAARAGILFRSAHFLEEARRIDCMVFDKTGTITTGRQSIASLHFPDLGEEETKALLLDVLALESQSSHPIAQGIVESLLKKSKKEGWEKNAKEVLASAGSGLDGLSTFTGLGLKALLSPGIEEKQTSQLSQKGERELWIGNARLMREFLFTGGLHDSKISDLQAASAEPGNTKIFVAQKDAAKTRLLGFLEIADTLRPEAPGLIKELHKLQIHTVLLSGDQKATADAIARRVGIDEAIAEVLPSEKADTIKELQKRYAVVAMVGDGINDAPALATAQIGFAVAGGSDVALETADVSILNEHLFSILQAIQISKATVRNIKENLFWAFCYNTIGIPIAALGYLSPWLAGGAMALSSITVVLNALRLSKKKLPVPKNKGPAFDRP